jgi:hypothetical protein
MAARVLPLLVGLLWLCLSAPAGAGWLDDVNEKACALEGGLVSRLHTQPHGSNAPTCSSGCFRYQITCRNGKQFLMAARYRPEASAADIFFYESGVLPKLLMLAIIAGYAGVAVFGSKNRISALCRHGIYGAVFAFAIWMWGAVAKSDVDILEGPLAIIKYLVFPVYVVYYGKAFIRGCNYLFVRHPVAPTIASALLSGDAIDIKTVAATLAEGASDQGSKPAHHYEHQAEKAREIAEQLERDAAVAEAALKRERARTELAEAEAHLELLKRSERG